MAHKNGVATERPEKTGLSIVKTGEHMVYHSVVDFWLENDCIEHNNLGRELK